MGLSITVGILSELANDDPEFLPVVRADFDAINEELRRHGLPEHDEPESIPRLDGRSEDSGFPYSFLHYLRRFYARWMAEPGPGPPTQPLEVPSGRAGRVPPPVGPDENPAKDPVLIKFASRKHHLLWHADHEGYYVPVDFPEVLEDDRIPGRYLGSSQRLLDELVEVSEPLGIALRDRQLSDADAAEISREYEDGGPYRIERLVWLTLFEAARLSIRHRAAIHFG